MTKPTLRDEKPRESLKKQTERLANFIMGNIPGEPSQDQGAIDTAIRLLKNKTDQRTQLLEQVRDMLILEGYLKGSKLIEKRKPTHGNCCTCQECGHYHDECVCEYNHLLSELSKLKDK